MTVVAATSACAIVAVAVVLSGRVAVVARCEVIGTVVAGAGSGLLVLAVVVGWRAAIVACLDVSWMLLLATIVLSPLASTCVHPAQVSHELDIGHVSQLRVVLKGSLDGLTLDRAHAHIPILTVRQQLTVVLVLELDDLVNVARRRCCPIHGCIL